MMERLAYLTSTFDQLNEVEKKCIHHHENDNPEHLRTFLVVKLLLDGPWTILVEVLRQLHESIMPEITMMDLSAIQYEMAVVYGAGIESSLRNPFLECRSWDRRSRASLRSALSMNLEGKK